MEKEFKILSIDGGGIKGLYSVNLGFVCDSRNKWA
jgi:patatin-like phospholipase/acyl hydrolase